MKQVHQHEAIGTRVCYSDRLGDHYGRVRKVHYEITSIASLIFKVYFYECALENGFLLVAPAANFRPYEYGTLYCDVSDKASFALWDPCDQHPLY